MEVLDGPAQLEVVDVHVGSTTRQIPAPILWLWHKVSSFPALVVALILAGVYWKCGKDIADPDIWWHLRNAQHLLATSHFPNFDTYSFSAAGSAWLNHEWLSEIFYHVVFRALGLRGVFLLYSTVAAILILAVFVLAMLESKDPFAAAITTTFGSLLAIVGFGPRTQHFGWLCFIGIYTILLRFRSGKESKLWLVPLLFCLWINCHGSWLIGLIIYGIFLSAGLIRRDIGRLTAAPWTNSQLKKLFLTGIASVFALFINPFGYRLVTYPFDMMFHQKLNIANVEEWASVNFNDPRGKLVAFILGAVLLIALNSRKRWRIGDAILTAFVLYCGLTHIRFLLLTGIVLPPILSPYLGRLSTYKPGYERRFLNSALLTTMVAVCICCMPSARILDTEVAEFFPVRAVEYLRMHPQSGHIFNVYQWGGYLEWKLPQTKTFIDSRTDIFEYKGVLKDYLDIITLSNSQEILDRYQVQYILYPSETSLPYFISKSSQWERIYHDKQAVIYRRVQATKS